MGLEASDPNISRSSALAAERKAIFHWCFSHFLFSTRNLTSLILKKLSNTFYLIWEHIPNPPPVPHFCHMLPLNSYCPPPTCPFYSLPPLPPLLLAVYLQSRRGSCPRRWIWVDSSWHCIHRNLKRTRQALLSNPRVCGVARLADERVSLQPWHLGVDSAETPSLWSRHWDVKQCPAGTIKGSCSSLPINPLLGSYLFLQAEHPQLPAMLGMLVN